MAPQKKLSVAEAQQWVLNAIAHLEQLPEDPKELTQEFFDETRPVDFKEPKKPRVSKKKSSTSSDISRPTTNFCWFPPDKFSASVLADGVLISNLCIILSDSSLTLDQSIA